MQGVSVVGASNVRKNLLLVNIAVVKGQYKIKSLLASTVPKASNKLIPPLVTKRY